MSGLAVWRAARRSDRGAIGVFECADPPRPFKSASTGYKPHHPRKWELEAQGWIRRLAASVPCQPPRRVFVVEDDEGLAAVVSWREVGGPAEIHVDVVGVALRHRRQGGHFAREVMQVALEEIEAAAIDAGADELYIEGEIWHENDASLALSADGHFALLEKHSTGAQTWSVRVPLAGAEIEELDPEQG